MNRITLLLLCVVSFMFASCQFSENIYINEDGSGKMEFSFDASEIMQMGGGELTKGTDEKEIDSTFTFKEIFEQKKDSVALLSKEEQEKLKALEPFSVHMVMSEEKKKMNFDISTDFKNANELQDMFTALSALGNLQGKGGAKANDPTNPFSSMGSGGNSELSYSFNKGVFKRTVKVLDKEVQKQLQDSLGQAAMMFGTSKYKLKYHFPRRIKSVSNENALFSADGKTVTIEYGLMEYMTDPEVMNLEIVLED
ncbi:hypothetical protein A8C32_13970 [Flavivirga aquatica]|uniref:Lipoprotein n=1 Tax=Flavivirga aquatica TaxID=1849968 RepID=A0A1E5TCC2_9FLAO|nr:hypothetical protein [Flavivirga aquatica]OEK08999.1 hypothetical protein A8C32_13970 [Flavivirga aquatica]